MGYVSREIAQRLPGVPVFPSLGNYDFVPVHSDPGPPLNSWLLHPLAEMFATWLDAEALETFKYGGYYEVSTRSPHSHASAVHAGPGPGAALPLTDRRPPPPPVSPPVAPAPAAPPPGQGHRQPQGRCPQHTDVSHQVRPRLSLW